MSRAKDQPYLFVFKKRSGNRGPVAGKAIASDSEVEGFVQDEEDSKQPKTKSRR